VFSLRRPLTPLLLRLRARSTLPCVARPLEFFEGQFQRQVRAREFELNPFERTALDYVRGDVLDLGCGLGNLALEAARRGCKVTAMDASATGIARIREAAREEHLAVEAVEADLAHFRIARDYDTIIAVGLLMFFRESRALDLLGDMQIHVSAGGRAVVNVLIEGTTYLDMFTPGEYYLFRHDELAERFAGWAIEVERCDDFPAPGGTVKAFATVIARKPGGPAPAQRGPLR
jgi:tellurite methyltransferase